MKVKEIRAKSILVRSRLPDTDYAINPYVGCEFGCLYCYASFMGRFVNEPIANWGSYVYAKVNAPEVLRRELKRLTPEEKKAAEKADYDQQNQRKAPTLYRPGEKKQDGSQPPM